MNNIQVPNNTSTTAPSTNTRATDASAGIGAGANNPILNQQLMNMFNQLSVS